MSMQADLRRFEETVRRVIKKTGKKEVEVLNKNALKVLIGAKGLKGAVHLTRKTTRAQIKRDLGRYKPHDLIYRLATKKLKAEGVQITRGNIAAAAEQIFKKRDASRAYLAAGWLKPARDLGGKNRPPYPKGGAAKSYALRATESRMAVRAYNVATGPDGSKAEAIAREGLHKAIQNATKDMEDYHFKEVDKILIQHSDR